MRPEDYDEETYVDALKETMQSQLLNERINSIFAKNELVINVPDIRAIYYKSQGDYVTALNSYQEVQSFYPSSSVPHFFKADLYTFK